jgi:hypothetical protein
MAWTPASPASSRSTAPSGGTQAWAWLPPAPWAGRCQVLGWFSDAGHCPAGLGWNVPGLQLPRLLATKACNCRSSANTRSAAFLPSCPCVDLLPALLPAGFALAMAGITQVYFQPDTDDIKSGGR